MANCKNNHKKKYQNSRRRKTFLQWIYGVRNYLDFSIYYKPKKKLSSDRIKYYHPHRDVWTVERYKKWYQKHKNPDIPKPYPSGTSVQEYALKFKDDPWYNSYKQGSSFKWEAEFDRNNPINSKLDISERTSERKDGYEIRRELLNLEWKERRDNLKEKWANRRQK